MKKISERAIQLLVDIANYKITEAKTKAAEEISILYNIGEFIGSKKFKYSSDDRTKARQWCEILGIKPATYNLDQSSRAEVGKHRAREKKSGINVFSEFACFKPLTGMPKVNGLPIHIPPLSHANIRPQDVQSIDADALFVIENLETFVEQLTCLLIDEKLPQSSIAIFRGSPHFGGNMEKVANKWGKEFNIPRYGFYDYDISGLIKAVEQKYDYLLLPSTEQIIDFNIKGNFEDLNQQQMELYLKFNNTPPHWLKKHIDLFKNMGGSFTQERLVSLGVSFSLVPMESVIYE
ncbi:MULTISPECIES: DUF7281 domain-containing protein [Pseudoalteromonas]|jgi:hypothetical protein|uniref:DUF7281 domain-containing protein n=1 Tax=Pseudoalteromonas rhizosphaerae TaxID=2518973 RepID=A0ABW8KV87_9GAMM|nr:hypothetical protein [Pseudoalteromonas prydzensis]PHQ93575.1 MAG: hypothetical protein COB48_07795 [Pseudoalteromonas sp.]|eukprot:TRINITY_DN7717_c0_g1_i1.p1 TRINITY_DN7717_c0_g1~~TRINITY_DN7717_c0_g1_i1.p1  ORF type:complete len:292 (-),score=54.68 TRINITY_DN7717_c0_g1_i1:2338-3213(-)